MTVLYVISMGHSGSTLLDCILGTHTDIHSSGEMRYLNWQLSRTMNKTASVESQDICSCQKDFRECAFWSQVFAGIAEKTGKNIVADPKSFDTAYFKQFAYKDLGSFTDRVKGYLTRIGLENGFPLELVLKLEPKISQWLANNWLLYQEMSAVSGKPIIVDSSKHLTIGLLLQAFRPEDTVFLFIHRHIEGLVSSAKRASLKRGKKYSIERVVQTKKKFERRVERYKKVVPNLRYIEGNYEEFVRAPAEFLSRVVEFLGISRDYSKQLDNEFYINPFSCHLVAGNPMRYRGRQKVQYDERWTKELTSEEIRQIHKLYYGKTHNIS